MEIFRLLSDYFGPRNWWPAENPFEVMIGAVLTQNTAWRNVEKALANLSHLNLTTAEALLAAPVDLLAEALRPSGYYNLKKDRLLALASMVTDFGQGGLRPDILKWPLEKLRPALLAVRGIGPETCDSIVLYAAGLPSFVVDVYTRRLLARHSFGRGDEPYEDIRAWFMELLPADTLLYNEFHALIVAAGHHFCGPKKPVCQKCPLGQDKGLRIMGQS